MVRPRPGIRLEVTARHATSAREHYYRASALLEVLKRSPKR